MNLKEFKIFSDDHEAGAPLTIGLRNLSLIDLDPKIVRHGLELKTATRNLDRDHAPKIAIDPDDQGPGLIFMNTSVNLNDIPALIQSRLIARKVRNVLRRL